MKIEPKEAVNKPAVSASKTDPAKTITTPIFNKPAPAAPTPKPVKVPEPPKPQSKAPETPMPQSKAPQKQAPATTGQTASGKTNPFSQGDKKVTTPQETKVTAPQPQKPQAKAPETSMPQSKAPQKQAPATTGQTASGKTNPFSQGDKKVTTPQETKVTAPQPQKTQSKAPETPKSQPKTPQTPSSPVENTGKEKSTPSANAHGNDNSQDDIYAKGPMQLPKMPQQDFQQEHINQVPTKVTQDIKTGATSAGYQNDGRNVISDTKTAAKIVGNAAVEGAKVVASTTPFTEEGKKKIDKALDKAKDGVENYRQDAKDSYEFDRDDGEGTKAVKRMGATSAGYASGLVDTVIDVAKVVNAAAPTLENGVKPTVDVAKQVASAGAEAVKNPSKIVDKVDKAIVKPWRDACDNPDENHGVECGTATANVAVVATTVQGTVSASATVTRTTAKVVKGTAKGTATAASDAAKVAGTATSDVAKGTANTTKGVATPTSVKVPKPPKPQSGVTQKTTTIGTTSGQPAKAPQTSKLQSEVPPKQAPASTGQTSPGKTNPFAQGDAKLPVKPDVKTPTADKPATTGQPAKALQAPKPQLEVPQKQAPAATGQTSPGKTNPFAQGDAKLPVKPDVKTSTADKPVPAKVTGDKPATTGQPVKTSDAKTLTTDKPATSGQPAKTPQTPKSQPETPQKSVKSNPQEVKTPIKIDGISAESRAVLAKINDQKLLENVQKAIEKRGAADIDKLIAKYGDKPKKLASQIEGATTTRTTVSLNQPEAKTHVNTINGFNKNGINGGHSQEIYFGKDGIFTKVQASEQPVDITSSISKLTSGKKQGISRVIARKDDIPGSKSVVLEIQDNAGATKYLKLTPDKTGSSLQQTWGQMDTNGKIVQWNTTHPLVDKTLVPQSELDSVLSYNGHVAVNPIEFSRFDRNLDIVGQAGAVKYKGKYYRIGRTADNRVQTLFPVDKAELEGIGFKIDSIPVVE